MEYEKTIVFDFDGVINSYISGWLGEDVIVDPVVPGIKEVINELYSKGYSIVVSSARCKTVKGANAVREYLSKNGILVDNITDTKPAAKCYIDDRGICFDGNAKTLMKKIENFKPWHQEG